MAATSVAKSCIFPKIKISCRWTSLRRNSYAEGFVGREDISLEFFENGKPYITLSRWLFSGADYIYRRG